MKCDETFNVERFKNIQLKRENSLQENKKKIKPIQIPGGNISDKIKEGIADNLAEFIRDIIALANATRQRGQCGYLMYGIEDNSYSIIGIEGKCFNSKITLANKTQEEICDFNSQIVGRFLEEYIAPMAPVFEYRQGVVEGKIVSYIQIYPQYISEPYSVKKSIQVKRRTILDVGQCWIRNGPRKGSPLPEEEKQYLYSYKEVPYIDYRQWVEYLKNLSTLSGASAETIIGYQELHTKGGQSLQDVFQQFIEDATLSILQIVGHAGSGKTVFIKDRVREAVENLLNELKLPEIQRTQTVPLEFKNYIPIFFSLTQYEITTGNSFGRELLQHMEGATFLNLNTAEAPEKLFKDEGKTWLVVLDGFDEIIATSENRAHLWGEIKKFANRFSGRVKVVITTRPDAKIIGLPSFGKEIVVAPLAPEQVISFLEAQIRPSLLDQFEDFLDFLNSEPELWGHLRSPLFLGTVAKYVSGGEVTKESSDDIEMFDEMRYLPTSLYPQNELSDGQGEADNIDEIKQNIIPSVDSLINTEDDPTAITGVPDNEYLDVEEPWLIGKLLNNVFTELWEHNNRKKHDIGLNCGNQYDTFCNLGEMAVHLYKNHWLSTKRVEKYLNGSVKCVVDLGLLLRYKAKIKFPTQLSKAYFAAFFLDTNLQTSEDEFLELIRDHLGFWEKCLQLLKDITMEDTTIVEQQIDALRKEKI